jgi:response regulator RpfG family c-di-GMP phosphodiesterase
MVAHRIMIVDDDKNVLNALRRVLSAEGREVECFADPAEALRRARVVPFDLVLSDYRMPGMDGAALLEEIRAMQPESARMIVSAFSDFEAVVSALNRSGIERFISKPWDDLDLKQSVKSALEKRDLLAENRRLAQQLMRLEKALSHQREELSRLERENPGITKVRWAEDGSILLDDRDL